jgi:ribonuclease VapC
LIIDTSAIIAMILGEEHAAALQEIVLTAPSLKMSAATYVELSAVGSRRLRPEQARTLERLLDSWNVEIIAFDGAQAKIAGQAYADYGKGGGHPAQLNLGDCFSYALATVLNEALLFVGNDFIHTDIEPAYTPGGTDSP